MIKEIRFSEEFDRAFKRLKKRYRSLPDDVKKLLASLVENPQQGSELLRCVSALPQKAEASEAAGESSSSLPSTRTASPSSISTTRPTCKTYRTNSSTRS